MNRGRWLLALVIGLALAGAGGYAFWRAAQLDDAARWTPHRGVVAREGMQRGGDDGSYHVTWSAADGTSREDTVETSAEEARTMVEHLGGREIDVRVYRRATSFVVCPTIGFATCVEHSKHLLGGYLAIAAGAVLILYALFKLLVAKRPGAL